MKTKLYTFYTDTHQKIYEDYFLASFKKYELDKTFDLVAVKFEQQSETGAFDSIGFKRTMFDKLELIKRAISENENKNFVYADCDIQFFGNFHDNLLSHLGDNLMVAQADRGTMCAGFFAAYANEEFKDFIARTEESLNSSVNPKDNDQIHMNKLRGTIKHQLLPREIYYTTGNYNNGALWTGQEVEVPVANVLVHHANFTIGLDNKENLLKYVKNKIEK